MHPLPDRRRLLRSAAGLAVPLAFPWSAAAQAPVTLTLWSWVPRLQRQVDLFERAHPNIKVQLVNAGQGLAQHLKLRNALKAGTGAPDVAHMEYFMIPSFRLANSLVDLAPHGAAERKGDYVPWAWEQVSSGNSVYAMPWDSGPLGLIYRQDIFEKSGLKTPATWDEFAEEAAKFKRARPDAFITNAAFSTGGWINALLWQGGSRPFAVEGDSVRVTLNDAPSKRVLGYWQKLIDAKLVDTKPIFTAEWYAGLDQGRYASWISAAWGPLFLSQFVKTSAGQWRASDVPQWRPGDRVSANWGGSTLAVMRQTRFPREAAQLAIFLSNNPEAATTFSTDQFLFPVLNRLLNSADLSKTASPFYGNQPINEVFIRSARNVDPTYRWSPFQDYVFAQMGNELGAAATGKGTLIEAIDRLQENVVGYAKTQGFTVRT
jgi:multiple sugar transport system substrate-binding protein